jgi:hypothetical protein
MMNHESCHSSPSRAILRHLVLLVVLSAMSIGTLAQAATRKIPMSGLNYASMPDFVDQYGMLNMVLVQRQNYSGWTDEAQLPPDVWFDNLAASYSRPHNYIVLDIESWPTTTQADRIATSDMLVTTYNKIKARRPELLIGFYAFPMVRDLFRAIQAHDDPDYLAWQQECNDFATLWAKVDVIYPSIYWFYTLAVKGPTANDSAHLYFHENIAQARLDTQTLGKNQQSIPYVWWERHDGASALDLNVWGDMMQTADLEGDGILLWDGKNTPIAWNENAAWWINFRAGFPWGDRTLIKPRTPGAPRSPAAPRSPRS